ncbi:MAG TPA: hypothetical protein VJV22_07215 [Acidobacteriaceae bacterium]|nr:hypothetical protein [Acidobacteriaceae bacterium]
MPTVSRRLPERPHLEIPKREARELLAACRRSEQDALERMRRRHPKLKKAAAIPLNFKLSDAQLVVAREYGFSSWAMLKQRIAADSAATALRDAIRADDRVAVIAMLRAQPELLHLPVLSGNWGPPMSHAANLGRIEIVRACAELGARDFQHAFDRAVLQGQLECARWLHEHGAKLEPGIIMGACETLSAEGIRFLAELDAPFTDAQGNRLAPLAMVLETYSRHPAGKHAILELFAGRGYAWPQTPMMAFHCGDVAELEQHLRWDPKLLERRFTLSEIFPVECGCATDGKGGMHWTPIDGTTLVHLAIDFREREIFDWALARGADVNARATVVGEGFGGHTPLFNAVVCGPWSDLGMTASLLEHGAAKETRASLRKFLDWIATPHWHEARNVTAAEWGHGFPEKKWVNAEALQLLD